MKVERNASSHMSCGTHHGSPGALWQAEALRRQLAECQSSLQHWQQEAARRQAALEEAQQEQQQQSFQPVSRCILQCNIVGY